MRTTTWMLVSVGVFLYLAGCGNGNGNGSFEPSQAAKAATEVACSGVTAAKTIEMENTSFNPDSTRIEPGDVVKWVNRDSLNHTVTNGADGTVGAFDSGDISSGGSYCLEFPDGGTVEYFCTIHGASTMSGVLGVGEDP